jgi:hypothetical protein
MAPIEPDLRNSNLWALLLLTSFGTLNTILIYIVAHRVLYRAYHALTPTSATRERESRRRKHVLAFEGLAFLSFSLALYYGFHLLSVSYQVWAIERGEPIPTSLWHEGGLFSREKTVSLKLGRWLHDSDLIAEIFELVLDRSSHQWWTQQLLLGAVVWSTYAAIEGKATAPSLLIHTHLTRPSSQHPTLMGLRRAQCDCLGLIRPESLLPSGALESRSTLRSGQAQRAHSLSAKSGQARSQTKQGGTERCG